MENSNTFWTTGYIKGAKVSFTFAISDPYNAYAEASMVIQKLLSDGFAQNEPGLEAGENKELVGYVARRQKKNEDGTITPVIDVYSPHKAVKFKMISVYLNTPEEIAAFEQASGHKLASLPLVPGKAALDKGDEETDTMIMAVTTQMHVIRKPNPRYDESSEDKKPKWLFVRWEAAGIPTQPAAVQPPANPFSGQQPPAVNPPAQTAQTGEPNGMVKEHWTNLISGVKQHAFNGVKPSGQEIANTINKMNLEGAFAGMSTYQQLLAAVIQRITKHYEKAS